MNILTPLQLFFSLLTQKKIVKAQFSVTYLCNSRCMHCNIWKKYLNDHKSIKEELTYEEIVKIIKNSSLKWISLTGGEPTLKEGIEVILHAALSKALLTTLNTNGMLPRKIEEIIEYNVSLLKRKYLIVVMSIDGLQETHERIRGVKGSFDKLIESVDLVTSLAEKRNLLLDVVLEMTVSRLNVVEIPKVCEFIKTRWPSKVKLILTPFTTFSYYMLNERVNIGNPLSFNYSHLYNYLGYKDCSDVLHPLTKIMTSLEVKRHISRKHRKYCFAGFKSVHIDPYGFISPCLPLSGTITKKVNIRNYHYDLDKASKEIRGVKCNFPCWTPCEASTTLLGRPLLVMLGYISSLTCSQRKLLKTNKIMRGVRE